MSPRLLLSAPLLAALALAAACDSPAERVIAGLDVEVTVNADTALFAGGCFWCMEPPYEKLDGVFSVVSGFAGGTTPNPTYDEVANGRTDHAEVVRVIYDPETVSYETLVQVFWHNVDPLAADRQFCDRGAQYRSILFYDDAEQQRIAEQSYETVQQRFDPPIATTVEPTTAFTAAEAYHQDFYRTNPDRYYSYREGCGRDARLEELWGEYAGEAGPL